MSKKKVAIIGYGNVGRFAVEAVRAAPDLQLVGVVRRLKSQSNSESELNGLPIVSKVEDLEGVEGAILTLPTRLVGDYAYNCLGLGINTVDSFDLHGEPLLELRQKLSKQGEAHGSTAIISAGWDPGTDSILRGLLEVMAPKGITFTNFGPGMSMGHTVAVKAVPGVKDALSMTMPQGGGIHRRLVYLELEEGADFTQIKETLLEDSYFAKDETCIFEVENVEELIDMGHRVLMERKGVSGITHNQLFKYEMSINNPALTAQIMVAALRATFRLAPGAYTMMEVPLIDFLPGNREDLLKRLI